LKTTDLNTLEGAVRSFFVATVERSRRHLSLFGRSLFVFCDGVESSPSSPNAKGFFASPLRLQALCPNAARSHAMTPVCEGAAQKFIKTKPALHQLTGSLYPRCASLGPAWRSLAGCASATASFPFCETIRVLQMRTTSRPIASRLHFRYVGSVSSRPV